MPHMYGHKGAPARVNPIDAMTKLMRSGKQRPVQPGEEFDHPYYKQAHTGVPAVYTDEQQIEFAQLAQSLTYADTLEWDKAHSPTFRYRPPTYAGGSGLFTMGGLASDSLSTNRNKRPGDQLSAQDLHDFLKAFKSKTARVDRMGNFGTPMTGPRSRTGAMARAFGPNYAKAGEWMDPIEMVRSGANLAASKGFGEGRTGYSKYVDPFEGVDVKKPKAFTQAAPTAEAGATNPGLRVAEMAPLPGSTEAELRAGKTGAGRAYRRRSRSASMTEQPTAGRLLGAQQGSQVLG